MLDISHIFQPKLLTVRAILVCLDKMPTQNVLMIIHTLLCKIEYLNMLRKIFTDEFCSSEEYLLLSEKITSQGSAPVSASQTNID